MIYKIVATTVAVVLEVGTTFLCLENQSVMTTMYPFPSFVFGNRPSISIATNSRGSVGWKNHCFRCLVWVWQFFAHELQS